MSEIIKACHICYSDKVDQEIFCDKCENYYCEECSYTFSLHYQHQGSRCYLCADQGRRNFISKKEKRDNKLKLYIHPGKVHTSRND